MNPNINLLQEFVQSLMGHQVTLLSDYVAPNFRTQKNESLKRGATGKVVGLPPGAMEFRLMILIGDDQYPIRVECLTRTLI